MTTTATHSTTHSTACVYCNGGTVWGGAHKPAVQCLVCKGSGRIPARLCPTCTEPMLDGERKRWEGNEMFHKGC